MRLARTATVPPRKMNGSTGTIAPTQNRAKDDPK
jgi:hypothetical protein